MKQTKEGMMKIRTKNIKTWDAYNFQVMINGKKFPLGRGEFYITNKDSYKDARQQAITWGVAEWQGQFVSRGGIIYKSKEHYDKEMEGK